MRHIFLLTITVLGILLFSGWNKNVVFENSHDERTIGVFSAEKSINSFDLDEEEGEKKPVRPGREQNVF
ncbi:hypothetical protein J2T56_000893 [Natronobacillus azotifigens]|uniref:Uncharacterized protein n=1 Tax=Natronobacillus azotifigens TaxID=472978 RepID=A0A9J6R9T2_9BACI|nr:hypothetical protein [Natronobacillus azotifigens]MCZ0702442.1 hypothetical protein [Natronobacillus azotifigens]